MIIYFKDLYNYKDPLKPNYIPDHELIKASYLDQYFRTYTFAKYNVTENLYRLALINTKDHSIEYLTHNFNSYHTPLIVGETIALEQYSKYLPDFEPNYINNLKLIGNFSNGKYKSFYH